jgi:altronate dehydratase
VGIEIEFEDCARLAAPDDNVAIASRQIDAGREVIIDGVGRKFRYTVLLGHRFATRPIQIGSELMSWGRPFGEAIAKINPGEYVCNAEILESLVYRETGVALPPAPNFQNRISRYVMDETAFEPAPPTDRVDRPATFLGYRRPGGRGTGTRNFIVVVGMTSRTGSFVRRLCERLRPLAKIHSSIDGIVPVAHTEGGDSTEPNNQIEVLRSLAGYIVHPNVGAVIVVDYGVEPLNNALLKDFLVRNDYPIGDVPHRFYTIAGSHATALAETDRQIKAWLPEVSSACRTQELVSGLSIAIQCGGSDAFSGISGNPLVGAVGHELVRHGGRVCLTETDELIGAEGHVLARVSDRENAHLFLEAVERFKERLGWHGASAEGNPSGGNKLRGLYNITLKSLGAAAKKSPLTRLDFVTDYAERIVDPGFTFMDGPGSDLEAVAGQVATGCNVIVFVTGNGSVTNFPFVPTIKVTTTTERHQLLINEMDVNAGRYLDGESMDRLRDDTFGQVLKVASGQRTKGEHAGHSQVMIWRNWQQTDGSNLDRLSARTDPDGKPRALRTGIDFKSSVAPSAAFTAVKSGDRWVTDQVGLILPTSMCSSEVARLAATRLNEKGIRRDRGISRFVALCHTEGCGSTGVFLYQRLPRTYRAYLTHPCVSAALVLEHGCEKLPNDNLRRSLRDAGVDDNRFGWASVQLDGGIEKVLTKIEAWFTSRLENNEPVLTAQTDLGSLTLGLLSAEPPSRRLSQALATLAREVVTVGGSVLVPLSDSLLGSDAFRDLADWDTKPQATLAHGEPLGIPGLHIVDTESDNWVENTTALGAGGVEVFVGAITEHPRQGHPFLPVLQVADGSPGGRLTADEVDLFLPRGTDSGFHAVHRLVVRTAGRSYTPKCDRVGLTDFQFTRGYLGVTS